MTKTKKKPNEYVMCIVVLTALCLVISAALALTNMVTEPVITEGALKRAEAARIEVLPEADGFELVEAENLPASVKEVYEASNGVGYVFMLTVKGYGGDMDLICGIDADGCITATKVLSHAETAGLGAKVAEADYGSQYIGEDASLSGVSAISGATISSKAYYGAIADAFAALETVKEAG